MSNPVGHPPNLVREAWVLRFNIPQRGRMDHRISEAMLVQLSHCRSDEARRIILGISS